LQWHITEKCNLKCKHCYFDPKFIQNELNLVQKLDILKDYFDFLKDIKVRKEDSRISITGGEPLISDHFWDILKMCYENRNKTRYGLLTNGMFLDEETIHRLLKLKVDYIQISLDGMEKINDSIRGKGTFKKIKSALNKLSNAKIPTTLSMTITKLNIRDVENVIEFSEKIGVSGVGFRRLAPEGRGSSIRSYMLNPNELKSVYDLIVKKQKELIKKHSNLRISIGCESSFFNSENTIFKNSCNAGYFSLTILPNGDVYPCRKLPIKVGNVTKKSIYEIFYSSKKLWQIRDKNNISQECIECPDFSNCKGGSKCVSFAYFKKLNVPDPQCWKLFSDLPENIDFNFKKYEKGLEEGWFIV